MSTFYNVLLSQIKQYGQSKLKLVKYGSFSGEKDLILYSYIFQSVRLVMTQSSS